MITRSDAASIAVVSSPPSPRSDDRLALGTSRQLGQHACDVVAGGAAELEPGSLQAHALGGSVEPTRSSGEQQ